MPFVSASIYHKATKLAVAKGMPPDQFVHHQSYQELQQNGRYIPIELLYDVYVWATCHISPGFCVEQGKQLNTDDYGTLGLSWKTCWQAKVVLERTERFMVLVTDEGSLRLEVSNGFTTVFLLRDANRLGLEIANEVTFVMVTGILSEITSNKIRPSEVTFKHGPRALEALSEFFECPVRFNSPNNTIRFRNLDIDVRTIKSDKSIHSFLMDRMDEEKQGIHVNSDHLMGNIRKLIEESLPSGIPSVILVAEHLGMSARTLKRRLSEKGLGFREYVQKIQQQVAGDLIKNTSRSMAEIAFQTGFSEQSAFNRAFKRWTGQSPVEFRNNIYL